MELWPPRNLEEHHFFQLWTASQQPLNISSSPLFSSSENCQKKDHHRRKLHLSSHICAIFLATTLFIRMQMAVHSFAGVSIQSCISVEMSVEIISLHLRVEPLAWNWPDPPGRATLQPLQRWLSRDCFSFSFCSNYFSPLTQQLGSRMELDLGIELPYP